jgi:hypothetical protein
MLFPSKFRLTENGGAKLFHGSSVMNALRAA